MLGVSRQLILRIQQMKNDLWICEICAEEFKNEIDLLAHQFNSSCEKEMKDRYSKAANKSLNSDPQGLKPSRSG